MLKVVVKGHDARQLQPGKRPHLHKKLLVPIGAGSFQKFDGDMVIAQYSVLRQPHLTKAALTQSVQQLIFIVEVLTSGKCHGSEARLRTYLKRF